MRLEPIEARYIRAHAAAFVSEAVTPLPEDVTLELIARIHAGETEEELTAWLRGRFEIADDAASP